jgi:hypothetical protein
MRKSMRLGIAFALCVLAITPRASHAQSRAVPVVITSDYYAQPKVLVLHALNNSGKDITGYNIIMRHKNQNGTVDKGGWSSSMSDMLSVLITTQMAKDPIAEERRQREYGNGPFIAGTTRDITITGVNSPDMVASADAIFYADGSFDELDERAFKQMLAMRQSKLLALKKANQVMRDALADETDEHPAAVALAVLGKAAADSMAHNSDGPYDTEHPQLPSLQLAIQNLKYTQHPRQGSTERERLAQYVADQEKRVELMTPHCHLEVSLKQ